MYKLILAETVKVNTYRKLSLLPTTMPACWCIVKFEHKQQSQIIMISYDDTRRVAGNDGVVQQPVASRISIQRGKYRIGKSDKDSGTDSPGDASDGGYSHHLRMPSARRRVTAMTEKLLTASKQ